MVGTLPAIAAEGDEEYMDVCREQLLGYFGAGTEITLVRQRRFHDGVRLQVAARTDRDNSRFATCWVANEEVPGFGLEQAEEMVAANERTPAPVD